MAVLLTRYLIQYHRVVSYFSEMEKTEDTELNNILDEICTDKEKRNIKIVQTAAVEIPCCIGIFEKRILIPDKKYSREELHYIILHEYTHLDNKDILTIQLINILCIVFWWNPFVYILKGDMYQSIEIRCDQTVTKKLKSAERGNYLTVILKEYKASVQEKEFRKPAGAMPLFEDHSDHLIERFRLVAEGKQSSSRIGKVIQGSALKTRRVGTPRIIGAPQGRKTLWGKEDAPQREGCPEQSAGSARLKRRLRPTRRRL